MGGRDNKGSGQGQGITFLMILCFCVLHRFGWLTTGGEFLFDTIFVVVVVGYRMIFMRFDGPTPDFVPSLPSSLIIN